MKAISLTILSASLISAGTARAETTVAVLGVEPQKAPAQVAARFSASLKEHVTRTPGFKLVAGKALDEVKLVFGCVSESPVCMSKVGRSLQASKLVWGALKKTRAGYLLQLKLLDVGSARIEKKVKKVISGAEAATPSESISLLVMRLLGAKIGAIKVSCNIVGAEVLLGTRTMGTTDASALVLRNVPEGTHVVQVRKDGYRTWVNRVQVSAGEVTNVAAQLELAETKPPVDKRPKPSNVGWRVAFYVGVAATVGAAVGLIVNGLKVLSLEKDKTAILEELEQKLPTLDPVSDKAEADAIRELLHADGGCRVAAAKAGDYTKFSEVDDICGSGDTRATVQNVLIGVTAGMAALSAFFAYKAFFSSSSSDERESKSSSETRWTVAPTITPQGGGVGFSLSF